MNFVVFSVSLCDVGVCRPLLISFLIKFVYILHVIALVVNMNVIVMFSSFIPVDIVTTVCIIITVSVITVTIVIATTVVTISSPLSACLTCSLLLLSSSVQVVTTLTFLGHSPTMTSSC